MTFDPKKDSIIRAFFRHIDAMDIKKDKDLILEVGAISIECFLWHIDQMEIKDDVTLFLLSTKNIFLDGSYPTLSRHDIPKDIMSQWWEVMDKHFPAHAESIRMFKSIKRNRERDAFWAANKQKNIGLWTTDIYPRIVEPFIRSCGNGPFSRFQEYDLT